MIKKLVSIVLLCVLCANFALAESLDDIGDSVLEQKVLEIIMKNPEVIEKTLARQKEAQQKKAEEERFAKMFANKVEVDHGNSPGHGNKDAKYQLVIFTDFECPYCRRGDDTVQSLKEKLGKDLYIVQKNYPLGFHKNAKPAAKAALAAHAQGKFFEYSKELFANQRDLGQELYEKIALDLKLDKKKFLEDMQSTEVEAQLVEDLKAAREAGVSGTPNFILNGVQIGGAYPLEFFEKVIEKLD